MHSCSAQLTSFEIDLISKEVNCAEHKLCEYVPLTYRAGDATVLHDQIFFANFLCQLFLECKFVKTLICIIKKPLTNEI